MFLRSDEVISEMLLCTVKTMESSNLIIASMTELWVHGRLTTQQFLGEYFMVFTGVLHCCLISNNSTSVDAMESFI